MHDRPIDILSINETRLDRSIDDKELQINGYNIVRKDRNREGGGVAIYYRDHLDVKDRKDLVPENIESVCIEVSLTKCKPLLITSLYRPPSARLAIFDEIQRLIENIDGENKEMILVGDLNCDLLPNIRLHHTNRFLDIVNLFQLTQIITEPTRVTANTETLIDLFLTNKPENISNSGVVHLGISDHSLIYGCRKISFCKNPPKLVESRNFKYYKSSEFKNDLTEILSNWDWRTDDPNVLWNQFRDRFNQVAEMHAPIRIRRVRSKYAPWLNHEIKNAINNRDYLKRRAVKTKSDYYHEAYKQARNRVNGLVKKTKHYTSKT